MESQGSTHQSEKSKYQLNFEGCTSLNQKHIYFFPTKPQVEEKTNINIAIRKIFFTPVLQSPYLIHLSNKTTHLH